jgi:RNA polymerase sigma-70 factor (ECF subfamily)
LEDAGGNPVDSQSFVHGDGAKLALLALAPKHQAVLALHYLEGLAIKDVAAILGCRVGTVKSRLARARDALRARLNIGR